MDFVTAAPSLLKVVCALAFVAMALTLSDPNIAFQKTRAAARSAGVAEAVRALKAHLNTLGNPDVKFASYSGLETADVVISDSACTLLGLYFKKPTASTTNAWLKGSDHATVAAAAADIVFKLIGTSGGGREYMPIFGDGLPFGTGLTLGCHTTNNGNTKSAAADAATGFAIVGAAI